MFIKFIKKSGNEDQRVESFRLINTRFVSDIALKPGRDGKDPSYIILNLLREDNLKVYQEIYMGKYASASDAARGMERLTNLISNASAFHNEIVEWVYEEK